MSHIAFSLAAGFCSGYLACSGLSSKIVHCAPAAPSKNRSTTGTCREGLPEITQDEVFHHNSSKKGDGKVWVTYRCGVYDVTDFVAQHPGGVKRILLAAGGDIEKFWKQFTIHDDDAVRDILESHRLGNLKGYAAASTADAAAEAAAAERTWANEPKRAASLHPLSARPFNAETPEGVLDEFITPNDLFFVRNHMPVPQMDDDALRNFCLRVEGEGIFSRCFRIEELKKMFAQRTVTTTIQCGGNRRSELSAAHATGGSGAAVKGLAWTNGAIGTATWTGVFLRDVIAACQFAAPKNEGSFHVQFEGADKDPAGHFNVSVPYDLAMDKHNDCLIAFEMNGEPIPRDHGFPLRAIVPGTVGVRNCKWLRAVTVQPMESQSVWQQDDYKNFPPYLSKPDSSLPSVYAMPVQSAITDATYDANQDVITVKGYAYAGGGVGIQRVDVSFDGGKSFETSATVKGIPSAVQTAQKTTPRTTNDSWAWRQLELQQEADKIKAPPQVSAEGKKYYKTCLKATTDNQASQPPVAPYNFRGLLFNGYSCRDVVVE